MVSAVFSVIASAVTGSIMGASFIGPPTFFAVMVGRAVATIAVIASSIAMNAVSSSLMGASKPKMPDFGTGSIVARTRDRTISVRQPIASHRVIYGQTRVGGIITFLHTTNDNERLHQLITIAGHEVHSIGQLYLDDVAVAVSSNTVSDTKYEDLVDVYMGLGTTSGDSALQSAMQTNTSSKWTSDHKQTGRAKIYTRFKFDADAFSGSLPNVTAIVQGKKVYDPRSTSTAYSNNPALCIRDYLTNTSYGLGEPTARINDTNFIAQANICDENVTLTGGGTEKRYTTNGVFDTDQTPKEIIQAILSSMSGKLTYQGGEWNLYVGKYATPTITLDESDLDDGIQVTAQVSRRELFNKARGVYVEPSNLYQPTDFPVVSSSSALSQDQSEVISKDFDFQFTTSSATAQRLAKIELQKIRQQITLLMPVSLKNGMRLQTGDNVSVTNTRMGWSSKVFTVEEWKFAQRGDSNSPRLGIDLTLRETSSSVYSWSSSEENALDPAPNTDLPDPFSVSAPTSLTQTESLFVTTNGSGVKVRSTLSWTASADSFVQKYEVQYKLSSDSSWIGAGEAIAGSVTHPINDISTGIYDFRVRAVNTMGVRSSYTTITSQTIAGLVANPADVTGLSLVALNNQAHITWDLHPDLDVRFGGYVRFRHSNLTSGAQWASSTDIGASVAGHNSDAVLPLLSGTYMARGVDSTGNESLNATSFVITTVPDITKMNAIQTISAHPDFTGTLVGLDVVDGVLKFESVSDFDSRTALLDSWTFFDSYTSGVDQSGTFEFDGLDLGAVYTSRLTHSITFNTYEIGDYTDDRSGYIDTWTDFENPPADLNLDLYVATTNDQVSGSPTWSQWAKFKVGDFTARGFKYKLVCRSSDADHQFALTNLSITIDMPDQVKGEKDIASGSSTKSVAFASAFYTVPSIGITANNMASGDFFTVTNKTVSGFDILFKNSSASAVDRNFNYQARGY
jgi:hypothetical protein